MKHNQHLLLCKSVSHYPLALLSTLLYQTQGYSLSVKQKCTTAFLRETNLRFILFMNPTNHNKEDSRNETIYTQTSTFAHTHKNAHKIYMYLHVVIRFVQIVRMWFMNFSHK